VVLEGELLMPDKTPWVAREPPEVVSHTTPSAVDMANLKQSDYQHLQKYGGQ